MIYFRAEVSLLTIRGIGKKLELIAAPWTLIAIAAGFVFYPAFVIAENSRLLLIAGLILLAAGLVLHVISAVQMYKGFTAKRLVTTGMFAFSRNPMYLTVIFMILPGLALVLNSWLIFSSSVLMLVLFLVLIGEEDRYLAAAFGGEYEEYKKKTGLFIPRILWKAVRRRDASGE